MTSSTSSPSRPAVRSASAAAGDHSIFAECLRASERVRWRVSDLIGGDKQLDFSRHFLPDEYARSERLPFLDAGERRLLSQIRGYVYLKMFVNIEAFVMPFVIGEAQRDLNGDDVRTRALLQFAAEEAKHTQMLNRFAEDFERGFGRPCATIGPPAEIAAELAKFDELSVGLTILMGEWVSLAHYVESIKDARGIDPLFQNMLKHHWLEESQHARMDRVLVEAHAATLTPAEIARGIDGFFGIGAFFDAGLEQQVQFDLASFELAARRTLGEAERALFLAEQLQALRWTFLGSGILQPQFLDVLDRLQPGARQRALAAAEAWR